MSELLSQAEIEAIKARAEAATPGPWRWRGNHDDVYLQSQSSVSPERPFRETVLNVSAEAKGEAEHAMYVSVDADLRFNVDGMMVDAAKLAVRPQSHNPWLIDGVDHPDATFIAAARTDIPALLADRAELVALAKELAEAMAGVRVEEVAPFVTRLRGRNRAHQVLAKARAVGLLEGE